MKGLTPREREVALLVELNHSNVEIARELGIKLATVKKGWVEPSVEPIKEGGLYSGW